MGIAKFFQRKARRAGKLVRMDRLRRSLRESFRRKKEHVPECSKPHQWQADEAAVRAGTCSFSVKYLGCVEVFESRGMQVCEEALKVLRNSRRRPIKGILYVTGDGLRVVEDETKGLIVDQTIEKVSFCAPDRNHDKGFSYICRDGTTRRWMCHGFLAVRDSGERLSHAVGCAFAACLERKQKRDKECGVTMTFDPNNSTFTRTGSFRQSSLTERMQDPQECKPTGKGIQPPPVKPVHNPFAIERPHATAMMLQRQGSFRGFSHLSQSSPFKRQLSLRLNELPSTLERQRSLSLESSDFSQRNGPASPQVPARVPRNRLHSLPNAVNMSPIIENSPVADKQESLSALCQQVTQGLSLLSNTEDPFVKGKQSSGFGEENNQQSVTRVTFSQVQKVSSTTQPTTALTNEVFEKYAPLKQQNYALGNHVIDDTQPSLNNHQMFTNQSPSSGHNVSSSAASNNKSYPHAEFSPPTTNPWATESKSGQSAAEAWLASAGTVPRSSSNEKITNQPNNNMRLHASPRRAPHLVHLRSQSLGESQNPRTEPWANGTARDPFDAEWAALATHPQQNTNPFQQNSMKAFEVQL